MYGAAAREMNIEFENVGFFEHTCTTTTPTFMDHTHQFKVHAHCALVRTMIAITIASSLVELAPSLHDEALKNRGV